MPNLSLIIGLITTILAFMGVLLTVNLYSGKMRTMGLGMLAGSAIGGLYIGLGFAVGIGVIAALILIYFFLDGAF
jgi:hypothetical protein